MNTKVRSFKDRRRRKRGVSPVIGVILMVAATIVIAAVVLAMLGGFAPPGRTYAVMATATERVADPGGTGAVPTIFVTYSGGPDAALVDTVDAEIDGVDSAAWGPALKPAGWGGMDVSNADVTVGTSSWEQTVADKGPNNDHIVVTATFLDGSTQVILDTFV